VILAQAAGALHSRTIENRIATANSVKTRCGFSIIPIILPGNIKIPTSGKIGQVGHPSYVRMLIQQIPFSESHDVVAAIHVDHFAGDAAAGVGGEENPRRADFGNFYIAS
jgi:hypothetical protein